MLARMRIDAKSVRSRYVVGTERAALGQILKCLQYLTVKITKNKIMSHLKKQKTPAVRLCLFCCVALSSLWQGPRNSSLK